MKDIVTLILKIIVIILSGKSAFLAVEQVSKENNVSFAALWAKLPSKYK